MRLVGLLLLTITCCKSATFRHKRQLGRIVLLPLHFRGGASFPPTPHPTPTPSPSHSHSLPLSTLIQSFSTSTDNGLPSSLHEDRLKSHGPNVLTPSKSKSMLSLVLEQFEDRLVQILLVVAAISGVFSYMELLETTSTTTFPPSNSISTTMKAFLEPIIILTILILNATVGVVLSKSAASSLTALKSLQSTLCTVIRSGTTLDSHTAETLVPGDLIVLRVGDKVPADCRIVSISTSVLMSDEGSLTGESATVEKMVSLDSSPLPFDAIIQDQSNMLFSGSMITQGACKAVVIGTGMGTEIGKIQKFILAAKETSDSKKTPLGVKLDEFGEQLTSIISAICLLVFVMNIPKFSDPAFNSKVDGAVYYAKVSERSELVTLLGEVQCNPS